MTESEFIEKYQKVPVVEFPNSSNAICPLLTVCVWTYNHEKYIAQCLEGILMQKTSFPYEIYLGEDESSDNTRNICIEYAKKYPEIIRLFLQSRENNIKINGSPTGKFNVIHSFLKARGKYIAICEGDDYWTDPYKLQKQVDFLENNIEYGLVHTASKIYNQKKGKLLTEIVGDSNNSFNDFLFKNRISTLTVMFRSDLLKKYFKQICPQNKNWKIGDYPIWLWFSYNSKIKYLSDCTSVYRLAGGSLSRPEGVKNKIELTISIFEIKKFFAKKYGCDKKIWNEVLALNAEIKIKKGLLIGSYAFYNEGINDKKKLGLKIKKTEIIYRVLLFNKYFVGY
jgi:glycosyltransferase involved in cell wall biosynthesis